jgi:hypothetical protein
VKFQPAPKRNLDRNDASRWLPARFCPYIAILSVAKDPLYLFLFSLLFVSKKSHSQKIIHTIDSNNTESATYKNKSPKPKQNHLSSPKTTQQKENKRDIHCKGVIPNPI